MDLPTGAATSLFTDIEGSARRWEHQPEAMHRALARHTPHYHSEVPGRPPLYASATFLPVAGTVSGVNRRSFRCAPGGTRGVCSRRQP